MNRVPFFSWGLLDQMLSSAATLLISIAVFREATPELAFDFSVAMVCYGLLISLSRSLTSEPLAVFVADSDGTSSKSDASTHGLAATIVSTGLFAIVCAIFGFSTLTTYLFVLAMILAIGVDASRTTLLANGHSKSSALRGVFQGGVVLLSSLTAIATSRPDFAAAGWIASSLALGLYQFGQSIPSARIAHWLPEVWTFFYEFLVTSGSSRLSILIATSLVSENIAVITRVGMTAFGPYLTVFQAMALLSVPYLARTFSRSEDVRRRSLVSPSLIISGLLLLLLTGWSTVLFLGRGLGDSLFGVSWADVSQWMPLYGLTLAIGAITAGQFVALRSAKWFSASLQLRIASGILQLALPLMLGLYCGVTGFFIGVCIASGLVALLGYALFRFGSIQQRGQEFRTW